MSIGLIRPAQAAKNAFAALLTSVGKFKPHSDQSLTQFVTIAHIIIEDQAV